MGTGIAEGYSVCDLCSTNATLSKAPLKLGLRDSKLRLQTGLVSSCIVRFHRKLSRAYRVRVRVTIHPQGYDYA